MEETPVEEGDTNKDVEVAPALIAVHPAEKSVAVAVGSDLRVFDLVWVFSARLIWSSTYLDWLYNTIVVTLFLLGLFKIKFELYPLCSFVELHARMLMGCFWINCRGNCPVSLVDESGGPYHKDSIRTICYGSKGQLFVSAGDDKTVKIWSTESWRCIYNV